jgi:hypothetical protein
LNYLKRYGILCLIFFCNFFLALRGQDFANIYITLPKQDLSIEDYLLLIEKNIGYKLAYSSAIIENRSIKIEQDSICVKDLLDTLFIHYPVKSILKENLLILSPQVEMAIIDKKIKISGTVKNIRTKKPVPFANVFIRNESIGTITNNEGVFEIFFPESQIFDTLIVSCLGFFSEKIPYDKFLGESVDIYLDPNKFIVLSEVIVRPENPREMVLKAINNKVFNYSTKPILLTAFFRESSKQDNNYISLSEAMIDIYKTSYTNESEDLIKLKKGRKGSNASNSILVSLVVEGGLYNNMQLDIMKYGVSFLDPDQMKNYEYTFERQTTYGGRHTYIVNFKFNRDLPSIGYDGKLYIDGTSFAVVRCEFEISPFGLEYAQELMIKRIPLGYQVKPKFGKYEVEYRMYKGCWNLMHGQSEIGVRVKKKRATAGNGFTCLFTSTSEFVITGKETEGFDRIKYKEASKPKDILYQQISSTDLEFWGNETIIVPEEPLLETIEKLKLQEKIGKTNLVSTKVGDK